MTSTKFAVANLKGGCGKSTLAMNLAAGLVTRGKAVLLDADPQGTVDHWASDEKVAGMPRVVATGDELSKQIRWAESTHQYVVVDCPPSLGSAYTEVALQQVDIVLVPVLPSPPDLWSSVHMVEAVAKARKVNPELRAYFVRNQVESRSALSHAMRQALQFCDLPALESSLGRRAAYRWAALEGISVYQFGARGQKAVSDIESIIKEVLNHE
jgi:chromosome partitioning protein